MSRRDRLAWEQRPCPSPLMPWADPISSDRGEQGRDPGDRACNRAGHGGAAPRRRGGDRRGDRARARAFPAWRAVAPRIAPPAAPAGRCDRGARRGAGVLEARNAGKPISDAKGEMGMVVETFRYYAGAPERLTGKTIPGSGRRRHDLPRAARSGRPDHAVELPAHDRLLEGRASAGRGQHDRAEAGRADPADRSGAREDRHPDRPAAGRAQRRRRPRLGLRQADRRAPRRCQGRVYGLNRGRARDRRRSCRDDQARHPGARRQVAPT